MGDFDAILNKYGASLSSADLLYTELFHLGEHFIQCTGEYRRTVNDEFLGNPMIYINDQANYKGKMKRYILLEDTLLDQLHEAKQQPSNLINTISYYGRKKDKEHADRCFGLIFDIDSIDEKALNNFLYGMSNNIYPCPNYLVISKSGKGMHLYYTFEEPVRLFPKIKVQLKELKYTLIRQLWNPHTSNEKNIQYQSYDQSFMVAGTYETMKVYKFQQAPWSVEGLSEYAYMVFDKSELWLENKHTLEEAKKLYPQWYEKVIVKGDKERGHWVCKRDLYDWWKRRMMLEARYGHRYWCMMMLVIYAVKSGVPYGEVRKDAYELIPYLDSIEEAHPFTKEDVESALDCYDVQFATFPIDDISRLSNVQIKKNKRNGRKQETHLKIARSTLLIMSEDIGHPLQGRKNKKQQIKEYRLQNPEAKPKECIKDTGLNKNTVYKWWGKK